MIFSALEFILTNPITVIVVVVEALYISALLISNLLFLVIFKNKLNKGDKKALKILDIFLYKDNIFFSKIKKCFFAFFILIPNKIFVHHQLNLVLLFVFYLSVIFLSSCFPPLFGIFYILILFNLFSFLFACAYKYSPKFKSFLSRNYFKGNENDLKFVIQYFFGNPSGSSVRNLMTGAGAAWGYFTRKNGEYQSTKAEARSDIHSAVTLSTENGGQPMSALEIDQAIHTKHKLLLREQPLHGTEMVVQEWSLKGIDKLLEILKS